MPSSQIELKAVLVNTIVIFVLAVVVLGLTLNNVVSYYSNQNNFAPYIGTSLTRSQQIDVAPSVIEVGGVWATFATGIGGTIDSILLLGLFLWLRRPRKSWTTVKRSWKGVLLICFISVVRSLTAVIYTWVEYGRSVKFGTVQLQYFRDGSCFTAADGIVLEVWNRGLSQHMGDYGGHKRMADQLRACRGISIVVFALYVVDLVLASMIWRVVRLDRSTSALARFGTLQKRGAVPHRDADNTE